MAVGKTHSQSIANLHLLHRFHQLIAGVKTQAVTAVERGERADLM